MPSIPQIDRLPPLPTHNKGWVPVVIIAALVLGLAVALNPLVQISSGYVGVLADFGSVQPLPLNPGLHVLVPFYQQVYPVSVQPQTVTSNETAATHDLQNIDTSIAVTFHIDPINAPDFYQNFRDFDTLGARIIAPVVSNDVKAVTANYDAEELVTQREQVDSQIKDMIVASLAPYHLTVETVNVANFAFSRAYSQAIEQKQVAQQQALQAQYTLQQAQITAQQQVVQAKAQADAAVATATGQAQALLLTSQAQAKANALIAQSLTPTLLQQKALDKWDGTLPHYLTAGDPLPFIGTDPTSENPGK